MTTIPLIFSCHFFLLTLLPLQVRTHVEYLGAGLLGALCCDHCTDLVYEGETKGWCCLAHQTGARQEILVLDQQVDRSQWLQRCAHQYCTLICVLRMSDLG